MGCSQEVREYFEHIPRLLDEFSMDVCLAYVFSRLELGQNMALYCGVVKVHKADKVVASSAVGSQHITRDTFVTLFETVFGHSLPQAAHNDLKSAQKTRDLIMHGKNASPDRIRNAIAQVLEYAEAINDQLGQNHGFKPFGSLQGFAGWTKKLDKRTTRFMLKGMGFSLA